MTGCRLSPLAIPASTLAGIEQGLTRPSSTGTHAGVQGSRPCVQKRPIRASLLPNIQALYPAYIDRYYASAPPGPRPRQPAAEAPGAPLKHCESWARLEAACAQDALFKRFVSPSFHVRAFAPTAILFNVRGAARCILWGPAALSTTPNNLLGGRCG
jgi:hypothetical protein